jgi:hypothetical protein
MFSDFTLKHVIIYFLLLTDVFLTDVFLTDVLEKRAKVFAPCKTFQFSLAFVSGAKSSQVLHYRIVTT